MSYKLFIWLLGLLMLPCLSGQIEAQLPESTPVVTVSMKRVPLPDILSELEKQTGMFFSYESSLIKDLPDVSLVVRDESLSYCLKRLFSALPVIYRVTGQYIILKRKPQLFTISGFVRDSASYESLLNATIIEKISGKGSVSNNYGFYSITLPPGEVLLSTSYVGYKPREIHFILTKDTLVDLSLSSIGNLKEVVVRGLNPDSEVLNSRSGVFDVPAQRVKSMPTLLGENDLIKTLQQLPGVAVGDEASTGLFVRGGGADQNLYLLDGNPVYQINHLLGFFSAFNPDAVKNSIFYKESFPAEYGGRLSSVVDVRTNDGDRQHYHGNISIGLLSARANLEGPIWKDRTSFNVSVRRTWIDLLTTPILAFTNKDSNTKQSYGFHFFDINAKVNHSFSDRSRLYLSFYMGQDAFRNGEKSRHEEDKDDFHWRWGNLIGSAGWNYVINNKLFANVMAGYSRFRSHIWKESISTTIYEGQAPDSPTEPGQKFLSVFESGYRSEIEDVSLRTSFDYRPVVNHRLRIGSDYQYHSFHPENNFATITNWQKESSSQMPVGGLTIKTWIPGHEVSFYAEDEMRLTNRLRVNAGLRYTIFMVQKETYHSLQPRLSARYVLGRNWSAKLSYSKMNQYVHLLSDTYISQPTDIWVPVTSSIPPMGAHQLSASLCYNLNKSYDFSLEGYYKRMNNLIEYKDHALAENTFTGWEDRVGIGKGRSYGLEFMVQKKIGKTSGWIGYTLSWSDRWFPDGSVNRGEHYPYRYDNRHKVNVVLSRRLSRKVELTGTWVFASGNHITIPEYLYSGAGGQINNGFIPGDISQVPGQGASALNNYQLSPYHRLDLGANFYRYKKNGRMGIWNLSVYNVYLQPNPFTVKAVWRQGAQDEPKAVLQQSILFLCMPSISYTYKF
ncbi:TonB-dependent receptor [Parabacteroides chinchillae]|uniref:Outer membrane receptor proteins, mostly Fe transport n=1 Tax=Parabacteroides chinchillae TaxID=871327 RepID=A0A8G2BZ03_9BACT|nr:TonB-dependent receptor [Parabacteroides chinchillae]SEG26673.1 Outer membrane receptor proteins, mostly Fe transport [Parabacteroides chinchillae]